MNERLKKRFEENRRLTEQSVASYRAQIDGARKLLKITTDQIDILIGRINQSGPAAVGLQSQLSAAVAQELARNSDINSTQNQLSVSEGELEFWDKALEVLAAV